MHELNPVSEPFNPEIASILEHYPKANGYLLTLFRVFANSRRFLSKGVANLLDKESPLTLRQRELVILRTTANRRCEYEWGVHVAGFASHAGFSQQQIDQTVLADHTADSWSDDERILIRVVDELTTDGTLSNEVLHRFQEIWTAEQQLEILALCGNYQTVCFVANTARLANESFGAHFPQDKPVHEQ